MTQALHILAVAVLLCLASGQVLTHSRWDNPTWRKIRWFHTDYWHLASALVNFPAPLYILWTVPGWWRLAGLAALWVPWQVFRPKHWGRSIWDPRRWATAWRVAHTEKPACLTPGEGEG